MVYCPNCGTELREGAAFCPTCGQAVAAPAGGGTETPVYPAGPAAGEAPPPAYIPPAEEKKPGLSLKKLLPVIIAAVVIVAAGLILILTLGKGGGGGKSTVDLNRRAAQRCYLDEDEVAYLRCSDGSCVKLKESDGVKTAYLTPDEKHIMVLTEEGDLYITDKSLKKKTKVESEVNYLSYVSNKGFLYQTEDEEVFRYSFQANGPVKVASDSDDVSGVAFADDSHGMLFVMDEKLYRLTSDGKTAEKLTGVGENARPLLLSNDGKTVIWAESSDSREITFYSWEGKEKKKLGKLEGANPRIISSTDNRLMVLYSSDSDSILLWKTGKEAVKVKLSGGLSAVRTGSGPLARSSSGVRELYIQSADNLYRVTLDGEKERLLSGVGTGNWTVADGRILWVKDDGSLRCGKLGKDGITDETKLDKNLTGSVGFSLNGKYIYYIKDTDKDESVLFGYKIGDKEPVRIDDEVYSWRLSPTGDTVAYFTDVTGSSGDLRIMSWGGESRKIASDVYRGTLDSGYYYYSIDPKGFWFFADIHDGYGDMYYWNGKEKTKVAQEIDY